MQFNKINDALSVAAQIGAEDAPAIAAAGFRAVICNRPDGESPGQPESRRIEAAVRAAGLAFAYLPVISGAVADEQGEAFGALLAELPGPVLAYCRSGTRCTALWSLSQAAAGREVEAILADAAGAGYDMRGLAPRLDALARNKG